VSEHTAAAPPHYFATGVGAGPACLSLAALFQNTTDQQIALFDKADSSAWHSSLLHPGVRMQTSWMKDLVSMVDPTHRLSFLNYLVTEGRLFAMLNAQFDVIPRQEYMNYLAWCAGQIDNIHFSTPIDEIDFVDGEGFYVISDGRPVARSEHVVIGVGTRPTIPAGFAGLPEDLVFIADDLGRHLTGMAAEADQPVAVVGGGQTGVEAVMRLLRAGFTDIKWLGRRQWFQTIDDTPAANEFYRPAHQQFLQGLTRPTRRRLIAEQVRTGDAMTPGALKTLYQANYDGMLDLGRFPVSMLPGRDVTEAELDAEAVVLTAKTPETVERHRVRRAVIAVGRQVAPVPFSTELRKRIDVDEDGEMIVDSDYSVRWKGMDGHHIYALNRSRFSHGIPDANLSLLPVRAGLVLNSMLGREVFAIRDELCPVQWG